MVRVLEETTSRAIEGLMMATVIPMADKGIPLAGSI
jgi:hypothetical protein